KGSGNIGSTNIFRILGMKWGVAVQALDISKGVLAVLFAGWLGKNISIPNVTGFTDIIVIQFCAGLVAIFGHAFSIFAQFRGGKGINTALGMLIAIAPIDLSIAVGIFILTVIFSGYISLGSIAGAIAVPSSLFVRYNFWHIEIPAYHFLIYASLILALFIIYTHRKNIVRLIKGRENYFAKLQLIKVKFLQPKYPNK
ncbi:MAG TPA: acyl-phosphate glycerol 3-phosphate acyltransferase, partial [Bacteroidetes bacterium]|nr:acyl-phosphate glycerol 3-phosphate acyltransferase [Bacteroidota bacterium]